jgi:hypothetical protein
MNQNPVHYCSRDNTKQAYRKDLHKTANLEKDTGINRHF